MKCDECDELATVHTAKVVAGQKQEIHLCRKCAEKRQLISEDKVNLPMAVKQFVGNVGLVTSDLAKLGCPDCGIKFMDFRKIGRLGCPYDYIVFRAGILPLLDRVHRATHHTGKRPKFLRTPVETHNDIRGLRHQLKQAITSEDYERAARLRDLIRTKEREHGS